MNKKTPIKEITSPAIAKPLGLEKSPTKDRTKPKTQRIQPMMGIHPRNKAINDSTKPAIPIPLELFFGCWIIIVFLSLLE